MSAQRAPSEGLPVEHRRAVILLGVFTLLLSLFSPLISLEIADAAAAAELAQGEPPDCESGFVVSDDGLTCVEDPNAQLPQQEEPQCLEGEILDPSTNTCVPDPNVPPQCDPGTVFNEQTAQCEPETQPVSVQLTKYECPPDAGAYQQDYNQLSQSCFQPTQPYPMYHVGPDGPSSLTGVQGFIEWTNLTPGQHSIGEEIPAGYAVSVWCTVYDPNTGPTQGQQYQPDASGRITFDVPSGWIAYCDWFNIPPGGGTITVYKWDCVEGTEYGRELDYYQGALADQETGPCETEHLNIPISLIHGGPQQDTTTQANGTQFDGVVLDQTGSFQIAITEPEGYGEPMVFCATLDQDQQQPVPTAGGAFTITPAAQPFAYQCNVYDILTPINSITVYKWDCAPGTEYGRELAYYQGGLPDQETGPCESEHLNIPISLIHGGIQQDTTTQANGTQFDNVVLDANASFQIQIVEPDGYGEPMVFCGTLDQETQTPVTATGGTFTITPATSPFTYQCNVYDIQTGYAQILIEKYWCPAGLAFVQTPTQADYQGACQETGPQTSFTLAGPGGPYEDQSVDGAPADTVLWNLTEGGQYTVTENVPEGAYTLAVFCHLAPLQGGNNVQPDPQEWEVANGNSIQWTAEQGYIWVCAIFNQPTDTGNSVTVYKWDCIEGTEYGQSLEYYQGEGQDTAPCETEHLDIPISLIHGGPQQDTTTQANGTQFNGVVLDQNGSFQIAITEPEGYGDPMVFCATLDEETQSPVQAPGGTFTITPATSPFTYQCNVYDIMGAFDPLVEGNHRVTVIKYYCPSETQASDDLALMQEACTEYHNGVPFSLSGENLANASEQTTVGGTVDWTDLAAGTYTLTESLPPGYQPPVIWCGYFEQNGVPIELASQQFDPYTPTEGAIQLTLEGESSRLVCYWYNFGDDENTVTVHKYDCDFAPPGYKNLWEWQEACPAQGDGYTFTLTDSEDASEEMVTAGGTASWTAVPEGAFTLSETMQPGWGEPVVWCGSTAYWNGVIYDGFPMQVTTTSGAYQGEISVPNTDYFCYWFNIPVDYSSVTVIKYICPEGELEGVVDDPLGAYQQTCTTPGNGIQFTLENDNGSSSATVLGGQVKWTDVPLGEFTITETVPQGYDPPIWFCGPYGEIAPVEGASPTYTGTIDSHPTDWICYVFDFPNQDRTVTVYKWLCPEGYQGATYDEWSVSCTMPWDGVSYTLTDVNGDWTLPTVGGMATWYGTGQGDVTLDEHIPPGYFEPVVYCSLDAIQDGAAYAEDWTAYPSTNGAISRSLDYSEYDWICHYFNLPKGPGEITVYKWLCPPGYDFYGWGANPSVDCTQAWDGVTYTLDQPVGPNLQSNTGDSIPGAVYFGGLDPGHYVITETVPADIDYVFVLSCTGSDDDKVHPYPLMWGNTLPIEVAGGDSIVCHWYNVPEPDNGWVTVYKYQCWTTKFTSAVDCELYEYGATFELFGYPGDTSYGTGTTNAGGVYTWNNLEEGAYTLDEISHKPCKITATKTDGQGHARVDAGQGTIIKVYNCKSSSTVTPTPTTPGGTPPKTPGKVPGKYPNTGVEPEATDNLAPSLQGTPTPPVNEAPEDDYYRISCLEGTPTPQATETATVAPDATATATPEEFDLPIDEEDVSTPAAGTPGAEEDCARGALPERVVIDAAQVDAGVETLEIVDGIMEQPTGPELVTWYKETGRLGEPNNVVIAGHLNYWNVPEGVFFYLSQLQEGDRVEVTGDDGMTYVFEVQWVRQESNLAPPAADVIGPTDEPSLTLITCGGEWNAGISEYDERTVARAVQVDVYATDDAADEAAYSPLLAA